MKAFVTGASGFLGVHLLQELSRAGWEIIALHRKTSDLSDIGGLPGVRCVVGDVTDAESLREAIPEGVDAVFHAAASVVDVPVHLEHTRFEVNQLGTRLVVQESLRKGARRFIYSSTVLTYDFEGGGRVDETRGPNVKSQDAYVRSKTLADHEVKKGVAMGLDAVFLHPSAIFGAYDKANWSKLFLMMQKGLPFPFAPAGGTSAAHMRKVAEAHVAAFDRGRPGEHYILGGPDTTLLEVMRIIAQLLGCSAPSVALPNSIFRPLAWAEYRLSLMLGRQPVFTPHIIYVLTLYLLSDSSKAERELGYRPSSVEEMVHDCYRWMVDTGRLPQRTSTKS